MMRPYAWFGICAVIATLWIQDPPAGPPAGSPEGLRTQDPDDRPVRLARPPTDAPELEPVVEPPGAELRRDDLIQRFQPPSRIAGMWQLVEVVISGQTLPTPHRGYLVFGRTLMSLHVVSVGDDALPEIQGGFRTYQLEGDTLVTSTLLGYDMADGNYTLEPPMFVERRRVEFNGPRLRVFRGDNTYMEFERIE